MYRLIFICLTMLLHIYAHAEYSIVYYERAYELIYRQLYHQREVPFKDIVFAIENAYLGGSANYDEYNREIERMVSALQRQADTYAYLEPTRDMALLRAISSCYIESNEANHGKPFRYDMLPTLQRNYPHYGLVTTLLNTGRGTCRSMPFLFKILADELGVKAYLSATPNHLFIQHQDARGKWWNFETTAGRYFSIETMVELTGVRPAGIFSKLYLSPFRDNELMIICLDDLMEAYFLRTGRYTDPFTRKCYGVGLLFYPNSSLLIHLYNDSRTVLCERAKEAGIKDTFELAHHPDFAEENKQVNAIKNRIEQLGFQDWGKDELAGYIQRMRDYVEQHPKEFNKM